MHHRPWRLATHYSTGALSLAKLKRPLFAGLTLLAVVLAVRSIGQQWNDVQGLGTWNRIVWPRVWLSGALVMCAYVVLIETWRRVVATWHELLPFSPAARIWFVSNLGRYVPGKVWQIGAMSVLAEQAGISGVVAIASALVVNIVNLAAGVAVVAATGAALFDDGRALAVLVTLLVLGMILFPWMAPRALRLASRWMGRELPRGSETAKALWIALVGCTIAWLLYGAAFQQLARAVIPDAPTDWPKWTAAFTGSYLLGYIALFAPGGIGVREGSLLYVLPRLSLATAAGASVVTVASRLWLTVLEVLPGVVLLGAQLFTRSKRK